MKFIYYFYHLAIGLFKKDISFVSWNRISILIILFSCVLSFNSYSVTMFNSIILFNLLPISKAHTSSSTLLGRHLIRLNGRRWIYLCPYSSAMC